MAAAIIRSLNSIPLRIVTNSWNRPNRSQVTHDKSRKWKRKRGERNGKRKEDIHSNKHDIHIHRALFNILRTASDTFTNQTFYMRWFRTIWNLSRKVMKSSLFIFTLSPDSVQAIDNKCLNCLKMYIKKECIEVTFDCHILLI